MGVGTAGDGLRADHKAQGSSKMIVLSTNRNSYLCGTCHVILPSYPPLQWAESTDQHQQDFLAFKEQLEGQQFYGPNDMAACSAEELLHFHKIPTGVGKHLIEQAKCMCKFIKDEVRAQKQQRVN